MTDLIYKIVTTDDWQKSLTQDTLPWSLADVRDGFMHLSTHEQVFGTLNKHFRGQTGLFLLEIPIHLLPPHIQEKLKWEKSTPEGDTYPHLYAPLPMASVANVYPIFPNANGGFDIPELPPIQK